jgi:hypothetical protein
MLDRFFECCELRVSCVRFQLHGIGKFQAFAVREDLAVSVSSLEDRTPDLNVYCYTCLEDVGIVAAEWLSCVWIRHGTISKHAVCRLECMRTTSGSLPKRFCSFLGSRSSRRRSVLKVLISRSSFIILELRTGMFRETGLISGSISVKGSSGGTRSSPVTRAKPLPFGLGRG